MATASVLPYHFVNTMTGTKYAKLIEDPAEYAHMIKRAARPLLVIGSWALSKSLAGKPVIDYAVEIAKTLNIPVCATAHTKKKLLEMALSQPAAMTSSRYSTTSKTPPGKG